MWRASRCRWAWRSGACAAARRAPLNLYGPTEDTTYSTLAPVAPRAQAIHRPSLAHSQAYVLDAHLQPVPLGVVVSCIWAVPGWRGVLGRPALTPERFVPQPFGVRDGCTAYRTGDLVRQRGMAPSVPWGERTSRSRCAASASSWARWRPRAGGIPACASGGTGPGASAGPAGGLCGARGAARATEEELRQFVLAPLPAYMVPGVVLAGGPPPDANGKLDRRALPAPERAAQTAYEAPRTLAEAQLARIWEELLQVHPIGIHDNFFSLGGHSCWPSS